MIIKKKTLKNVLFVDIETVSRTQHFHELPETLQYLWKRKSKQFLNDRSQEITEELATNFYSEKAGMFAEFGKVICMSVGYLSTQKGRPPKLRIKTFHGDEKKILKSFNRILNNHYDDFDEDFLCGHNIKEFDIPFICRRNVIHGLRLPRLLNVAGKKPWQLNHLLDTMDMWRFGDYKNYTSLDLLAGTFGIPSPKADMDGSKVGSVYWEDNDMDRIIAYCQKDVITIAQIAMKFAGQSILKDDQIEIVEDNRAVTA